MSVRVSLGMVALVASFLVAGPSRAATTDIDNSSRESVASAYTTWFRPTLDVPVGFTGDVDSCVAGGSSSENKKATLSALNYMRAMLDLAPVVENRALSVQAQASALIMEANQMLTHNPGRYLRCWTSTGYTGAKNGNLFLSYGNSGELTAATGPRAVHGYMDDPGDDNKPVGHRRWLMYPALQQVGLGDTRNANTIVVLGGKMRSPTPKARWSSWPTAGYFPWEIEPKGRWSVSYPGADFSKAKVTVSIKGKALSLVKHRVNTRYAESTLVFDVTIPRVVEDVKVDVTITGTKIKKKPVTRTFSVTLFDVDPTDKETRVAFEQDNEAVTEPVGRYGATAEELEGYVKPSVRFLARACRRDGDGWMIDVDTVFFNGNFSAHYFSDYSGPRGLTDTWVVRRELYLSSKERPTGTVVLEQASDMAFFLALTGPGVVIDDYIWPDFLEVNVGELCAK